MLANTNTDPGRPDSNSNSYTDAYTHCDANPWRADANRQPNAKRVTHADLLPAAERDAVVVSRRRKRQRSSWAEPWLSAGRRHVCRRQGRSSVLIAGSGVLCFRPAVSGVEPWCG